MLAQPRQHGFGMFGTASLELNVHLDLVDGQRARGAFVAHLEDVRTDLGELAEQPGQPAGTVRDPHADVQVAAG